MPLQRAWLERGVRARLLWPVSFLYGALSSLRRALYRRGWLHSTRIGVPVVIVGNVIAGGAGKTPTVMAIVRHWQARGLRVGVISRGYGRHTTDCREVLATSDPADVGDEPALIHRSTGAPTFVARRRVEAAHALLAHHPDTQVLVSDDGLQHLALAPDIELCVFDDRGTGNGWLLPAGPLREPWPRRCDLVLHTGARPAFEGFRAQRTLASHAVRSDGSRLPLDALGSGPLVAVAAIAKPESFFEMLRTRGLVLQHTLSLPDHDDFSRWQRPDIPGMQLLCTEKDAPKLWRHEPLAWAVPLEFTPEAGFFAALDAKLSSVNGHQAA